MTAAPARTGRPAVISRDAIAEAAASLGDEVSIRAVAAKLGVSVAAIYHWVDGRDEIVRLVGERSLNRFPPPADHGQHWAVWLLEWAQHVYRAFSVEPSLLKQFTDGTLDLPRMLEATEMAISLLVRQGFSEAEAARAFHQANHLAIGATTSALRDARSRAAGKPLDREWAALLARTPDELPHLRALAAQDVSPDPDLRTDIATLVAGIAVGRGEDWQDAVARLDEKDTSAQ